ncbi:MAG: hypothetical protein H6744_08170 [Deltaproteobacteria bacterium]|nr:hypothetical protein [Deltaproteobacteria bacterium]
MKRAALIIPILASAALCTAAWSGVARASCSTDVECDDGNPCTADVCPAVGGECVHDARGWASGHFSTTRLTRTGAVGQERLGASVAMDGDLAVFGALASPAKVPNGGAAVVFARAGGAWTQQVVLTGDDTATNDAFGTSVAISGKVVVVGAPVASPVGNQTGAVYVFRRISGAWTQTQRLIAPDPADLDWFGQAVAISGDTLVVGSPRDDDKGASSGGVYVFRWDGVSWNYAQKVIPADGAKGDEFGAALALAGDMLVVGARYDDDPTAGPDAGSAYVFRRGADGFAQEAKLRPTDLAQFDLFGSAVAVSGARVVVGAPQADVGGVPDIGAAWVFGQSEGGWAAEGKLVSTGGSALDKLGSSVAISGDTALVGAPLYGTQGASYGAAWFYRYDGDAWVMARQFLAPGGTSTDELGQSVALHDDYALIGAHRDPTKAASAGAVHALVAAPPVACDDDNPCTIDVCDPETAACDHMAATGPCADGDPCTVDTICVAGECINPLAAAPCDDFNPCTDDVCLGDTGCERSPIAGDCDDGDACTAGDTCDDGECEGETSPVCDDGNPCTSDSCDPSVGCVATPQTGAGCDDADPCTVSDQCTATGACAGAAKVCDAPPAAECVDADTLRTYAATGSCDAGTGECTYAPQDSACPFGCDGGACATTECQVASAGAPCDDGDPCTTDDACDGEGGCGGAPRDCSALDGVCVVGTCSPTSGTCVATTRANGTPCDDGNACTADERCQGGLCGGGSTVSCNDGDPCTVDSCDSKSGCVDFVIDGCCTETRACESVEACVEGLCEARFCDACSEDAECGERGLCAQGTLGGFCTVRCADGCVHGSTCDPEFHGGSGEPVCVPEDGLPEQTTRCVGDAVVAQVGCGADGDTVETCDTGCVAGACCPEGSHAEAGACAPDEVEAEATPDEAVEEVPDAGAEVDAAPEVVGDAGPDGGEADLDPTPSKGGGCTGGGAPGSSVALVMAMLALGWRRRRAC